VLRCAYVDAVAVRPDRRRHGLAHVVLQELERLIQGGFEIGALRATAEGALW
jgi:aminoglycoside 2'-N-acetyltransferase I